MQRELLFNPSWSWWAYAAGGLLAAGLVVYLYRLERVEAGRLRGLVLIGLRLLLVGLVLGMLLQPVLRTRRTLHQRRQVAVLLDDSLSMRIADPQAPPAERLRLADGVGLLPHDARPIRPEVLSAQLDIAAHAAGRLGEQFSELRLYRLRDTPVPEALARSLPRTGRSLAASVPRLEELAAPLAERDELRALLPPPTQAQWVLLNTLLTGELLPLARELARSAGSVELPRSDPADLEALRGQAARLAGLCRSAARMLDQPPSGAGPEPGQALAWAIDAAAAERLDAETAAALDRVGQLTREQLARLLLSPRGGDLLGRLARASADRDDEQFDVQVYRFARTSARLPADRLFEPETSPPAAPPPGRPGAARGAPASQPTEAPPPASTPRSRLASPDTGDATDVAAGINDLFIQADPPASSGPPAGAAAGSDTPNALAGIIVLTDGLFNGPGDPAGSARQHRVPIYPIRFGSGVAPTDLAVLAVEAPESLFREDAATVTALVKTDGLAGREVRIELRELPADDHGEARLVDTRRLRPGESAERRQVEFRISPDRTGTVTYRVSARLADEAVAALPDAMPENDHRDFAVQVTGEQTCVLVVDGPPRWEFQYITNLLLRDKGVVVQHLCFNPAYIHTPASAGPPAAVGQRSKPVVHASVKLAREQGVAQVDAWPETVEELLAFDVVILGDVPPSDLPDAAQRDLERFVSERGGTLVCIAGKSHMPDRYAARPLADLLPVRVAAGAAVPAGVPAPFRVRLTESGLSSELLRLSLAPGETQRVWDRIPPSTWRDAAVRAKSGATVLAYAAPVRDAQDALPANGSGPADAESAARQRPLMLVHHYGLGRVLFLAYDRTWQIRYKVGDRHHHKLWAQIMRWATAGRLGGGDTPHVRIGADRARYRPGQRVTLRARLAKDDFTPVTEADVAAELIESGRVLGRVNLLAAGQAGIGADDRFDRERLTDEQPTTGPNGAPDRPDASARATDGVFVATLDPLPAGRYRVVLRVADAQGLSAERARQGAAIEFVVEGDDPVELLELAARSPTEIAQDGLVLEASSGRLLEQMFDRPVIRHSRVEDLALWSSGWLLLLFTAVICAEWIMRKKAGLI